MSQLTCSKCSRPAPRDAAYCYFDGFALPGAGQEAGPVAAGSRPFNSPFVFPSGRTCRNFDELALACQEDWKGACTLLKDGYLESFLGGLGRIDLALAAKEASRAADTEFGLDQLLGRLPTTALPEPKLRVDPLEVNLGVLDGADPRSFTLELENQGMRLLSGTVTSDAVWLSLGDVPGANDKHFHLTNEGKVSVTIRPNLIRASSKPVEGKLLITSNGGEVAVVFRAEKPIKPFPAGPLTGAMSPRQVAEKAMASQKEVAPYFEQGQVEAWYNDNGWIYPVKLPAASGLAAIQQFFEALGLTKPPKVVIDRQEITLLAEPGSSHSLSVEVSTQEKRPVFAHATSNVPWLEVGRAKFAGKSATVPMSIPSVPNAPGQVLRGEVTVISNGNARWVVPVLVEVAAPVGAFDFDAAPPPMQAILEPTEPLSVEDELPAPLAPPPPAPAPPPPAPVMPAAPPPPAPKSRGKRPEAGSDWWVHAIPAFLLLVVLGLVALYDIFKKEQPQTNLQFVLGPKYDTTSLTDKTQRVALDFSRDKRIGLMRVDGTRKTKLTSDTDGEQNSNTYISIDGTEYRYGNTVQNRDWVRNDKKAAGDLPSPYIGRWDTFRCPEEDVDVVQYAQIVPGQARTLDTALFYYRFHNTGKKTRKVALRVMLDTLIGKNDGAPFLVPGRSELVKTWASLKGDQVPDYLEVIENPNDSTNPGTVARVGLKGLAWSDDVKLTEPSRVLIAGFSSRDIGWDVPTNDIGKDSCVTIYWPEVDLKPGAMAHFAFTYGMGALDISKDIALSAPGGVLPGSEFTITGYVYNATAGQKVTLDLPDNLQAVEGLERTIEKEAERAQVFWRVRAVKQGAKEVHAVTKGAKSNPIRVVVNPGSIFG
jgi:hypothetical protein